MSTAGSLRRSWKPIAEIVLGQVQKSGVPPVRSISTTNFLPDADFERGFVRSWLGPPGIGNTLKGSMGSFQARWASGNPSALKDEERSKEGESQAKSTDPLVKSNYWGIDSKSYFRADGTTWPWNCFRPGDTYAPATDIDMLKHHVPQNFEEKFALWGVKKLRIPVDLFFNKRYGCRAMMLETVAAVPGMVGGMLLHLRSLRRFEHSGGWIKALLEEAENERMHLMTLYEVVKPNWYERGLVVLVQGIFFNAYFVLYLLSPRMAHRFVGYLEEEAIISYTHLLSEIDKGKVENGPAPLIAIDYWRLPKDATFRDVIVALRADEAHHRDVNHYASDIRLEGKQLHESPAPVDYH